ncbi:hypothetical protein ACTHOQ_01540 [Solibacillus silvestris]|uniref:hypothetical protein n=1 Tax=Solibacillus silvestris TaxID=76853 RepID=UPI003F7CFAE6
MKKIIAGISVAAVAVTIAYFSATNIIMNNIKDKILENNAEIDNILKINSVNSWGEWFLEYALEVEIDGRKFRIWTNNDGEITDKEALQ